MPETDSPNLHHLHHLLWECYTHTLPIGDEVFADSELTLPLAGALDMIGTWPGSTTAGLARRMPKTQQAISQLVARLESLGYVERRLGTGRGIGLYLTREGELARADGNRREELLQARLGELLGGQVLAQLTDALEQARSRFNAPAGA
ncbi:MAG: MarR family transcriptional regulator [Solirubrobacterales bacterium]|nr:MarR family transcriptional regulator [Solirubrobacterales bacterium]